MTARRQKRFSSTASMLATIAGVGLSVNAFATNDKVCDSVARADLDVPAPAVSMRTVDYPADTSADITEALDLSALDATEVPAMISLSPRVATVIEQMFANQSEALESAEDATTETPAPVAESGPLQPGNQLPIAEPISNSDDDELQVPGLQDQMFRKDI